MKIRHILRDGREVFSIADFPVSRKAIPELYDFLERRKRGEKNCFDQRNSAESGRNILPES